MNLDKITASASPSPNRWSDKVPSREMTVEEIHEFVEAFAKCAKLLQDAGVDGVEIHAVHEGDICWISLPCPMSISAQTSMAAHLKTAIALR